MAADLAGWVEESAALVGAEGWPSIFAARAAPEPSTDLGPLVVVGPGPVPEAVADACRGTLEHHTTVAVVVLGGGVEGATAVTVSTEELSVPSLGLRCRPQGVAAGTAEAVEELLADASEVPSQLSLMPEPQESEMPPENGTYHDPPYDVLVRVLGDIGVDGAIKPLSPKQTALVTYIALNAPVSAERIEDALWVAPTASRRKRLANTVSETRSALGPGHLPFASSGRYRMGPRVLTDIELFERRLAYAAAQDPEAAVETLRGALELVRGPVFTYRNADRASYVWVDVDNWISTWDLRVTETAEDLTERYLALGKVDAAIWSARKGLEISAIHPRLTKLLMQAHVANGDDLAAARVFASHEATLVALELEAVDPELVSYYRNLRTTRERVAG